MQNSRKAHIWDAGVETVYDVLQYAARVHGERNAVGWRDVLNVHQEEKTVKKVVDGESVEEKKKWSYFELSGYKYVFNLSYPVEICSLSRQIHDLHPTAREGQPCRCRFP